ncbi:hypothetical protein JCM18382A_53440 [Bradyrhizobium sp. 17-4]
MASFCRAGASAGIAISAIVLEQPPSASNDASSTAAASPLFIRSIGMRRIVPNKLARTWHGCRHGSHWYEPCSVPAALILASVVSNHCRPKRLKREEQ